MTSIKLEIMNLTKAYGKKTILNNLSLQVKTGEFFVVLGPSGEGKSTLLKMMAGIEDPDSGRVLIDGKDVTNEAPNKRNIAMVFQSYALYPNMKVRGNIEFPLKMRHLPRDVIKEKVLNAARLLKIDEVIDQPITKISGGQKQRVALARAIVRDPALFLLDEPLSNLDARTRFSARGELKRIQRELGQTFVFVTHDQKEAASLADTVGVLHQGAFEQIAPFQQIYDNPKTKWIGDFVGDFPMNFIPADGYSEIGFRPEWARIVETGTRGATSAKVESLERVGDIYYLFCRMQSGVAVTLKGADAREIGSTISFSVDRYNTYQKPAPKDATLVS
jgi:ABC-type sugar transport system ATPase subunit